MCHIHFYQHFKALYLTWVLFLCVMQFRQGDETTLFAWLPRERVFYGQDSDRTIYEAVLGGGLLTDILPDNSQAAPAKVKIHDWKCETCHSTRIQLVSILKNAPGETFPILTSYTCFYDEVHFLGSFL